MDSKSAPNPQIHYKKSGFWADFVSNLWVWVTFLTPCVRALREKARAFIV